MRVERAEILDYVSYEEQRDVLRRSAMRAKSERRVHVASVLTFLFENQETVRYQIQEMTRAERMVKEADIRAEIETYNELLGQDGEIGCTLLIEVSDPAERARKLASWLELPGRLYVELEDGTKIRPRHDERQVGETRVSSVQYLKFPVHGQLPVAVGCDLDDADVSGRTPLTPSQRDALRRDLAASGPPAASPSRDAAPG